MKNSKTLEVGTIFLYLGKTIYVASEYRFTNIPKSIQYLIGWNGSYYNNCVGSDDIQVLNTNFIGSNLSDQEILKQYKAEAYTILLANEVMYNGLAKTYQQQLNAYQRELQIKAEMQSKEIKPKPTTIEKLFQFGGQYNTPIINIRIIDKPNASKIGGTRWIEVNSKQLDKESIDTLVAIINAKAGNMILAPDTIKWGQSIGFTKDIRAAIDYFFNK